MFNGLLKPMDKLTHIRTPPAVKVRTVRPERSQRLLRLSFSQLTGALLKQNMVDFVDLVFLNFAQPPKLP